MLEYSGTNLKLGELHIKRKFLNPVYLPPSLAKPVGVLATKSKKVYLEGIDMKKLEGDSPSNITTLKYTERIVDVSDDILSNIEEFQGYRLNLNDEKWCLLFKNLHTFKYIDMPLSDSVVAYVTNNPTLKNVSF